MAVIGSTVVLRRKFDPAECVATVADEQCDALVVIPVMMQRILQLPEEKRSGDYSRLRVVAASGSALAGDLATEWMDAFGENLYNTYGSTEVAWATIATPADMRAAPGTAGTPTAPTPPPGWPRPRSGGPGRRTPNGTGSPGSCTTSPRTT